ncbi:MAG: hypothetical protein IT577_20080 [Verrucomicrobiae bacterium]|nr:hypothetical protein [Verrucomicrobiae bacterium]
MDAIQLAQQLIKQQRISKQLLENQDIEGWLSSLSAQFTAADQLRIQLLENPVVVTDDPIVRQLLDQLDLTELENPDRIGSQLLFSWISPTEYAAGLAQVKSLLVPFTIPYPLHRFVDEARTCYALGQYAAVQSLSRTILEAAVNDIAVRTGKIPPEAVEKDMFKEYPPRTRIRLVTTDAFDAVYAHYRDLCSVVHGLSTTSTVGTLGAITKTLGFVQHLYEIHKADLIRTNP